MKITLKVYEKDGTIKKEVAANSVDIMFGTVRRLMALFKVDKLENTAQVLETVSGAWNDVTSILNECFTDMTEEDWDGVKVKELLPVVLAILKDSFAEILNIPTDPKNAAGE